MILSWLECRTGGFEDGFNDNRTIHRKPPEVRIRLRPLTPSAFAPTRCLIEPKPLLPFSSRGVSSCIALAARRGSIRRVRFVALH